MGADLSYQQASISFLHDLGRFGCWYIGLSSRPLSSVSFKTYLLEIVIRSYVKLQSDPKMADVASSFLTAVIEGADLLTKVAYRQELRNVFERLDHLLRSDAFVFKNALDASLP